MRNLHRIVLLTLFLCPVELCRSQQVPTNQLKQIESKIRRVKCDKENATLLIDGPLEPKKWYEHRSPSDYRIVFVLKEAYGADGQGVLKLDSIQKSYSSLLSMDAGEGRPTYGPMVTITNMLVKNQEYGQVDKNSTSAYKVFKENSAIVEVKKEYGTSKSSNSTIRRHAIDNRGLIEEQIRVYNPNVVIICSNNLYEGIFVTHDVLGHKVFGVSANNVGQLKVNSKFSYYYNDNCIYINTYHPSSRVNKNDYCTEIVEAVREWMEKEEN